MVVFPLGLACLVAAATGEYLVPGKQAAATALVCLAIAAPLAWHYPGAPGIRGEGGGGPGGGEEGQPGENIPEYAGTLFRYDASFRYLSSEDNGPIESGLFIIFPCPTIDNEPVLSRENMTWQLFAVYENDGENILQLEIDNGVEGGFVEPRDAVPLTHSPWIDNTSHGPKIWHQIDYGLVDFYTVENAFYQNEEARVVAEFVVPENENADGVTLVDNWGGVFVGAAGYVRGETINDFVYKPIRYSMDSKLSKRVDTTFETVESYSTIAENLSPGEWVDIRSE